MPLSIRTTAGRTSLTISLNNVVGDLVGMGVRVGRGVAVGRGVGVGCRVAVGTGVAVGVGVGAGVAVGVGVGIGVAVAVGTGVAVGVAVGVGMAAMVARACGPRRWRRGPASGASLAWASGRRLAWPRCPLPPSHRRPARRLAWLERLPWRRLWPAATPSPRSSQ